MRERGEEDGIGAGAEATAVPVVPSVLRGRCRRSDDRLCHFR